MPANPRALTDLPAVNRLADRINCSDHFVARNARVLDARHDAFFRDGVAVAYPAGLNPQPDRARNRLRNFLLNDLERTIRASNLNAAHPGLLLTQ